MARDPDWDGYLSLEHELGPRTARRKSYLRKLKGYRGNLSRAAAVDPSLLGQDTFGLELARQLEERIRRRTGARVVFLILPEPSRPELWARIEQTIQRHPELSLVSFRDPKTHKALFRPANKEGVPGSMWTRLKVIFEAP